MIDFRRQILTSKVKSRTERFKPPIQPESCFKSILLADQITVIVNGRCVQTSISANVWSEIKQIGVIFTHLKLLVAVARHNFKGVEIEKDNLASKGFRN